MSPVVGFQVGSFATISSAQAWGIEATGPIPTGNTGVDAFPNYDAYLTLCAAIRVHHGWPAERVVAHKEIARPDGRKIDPAFGSAFPAPYPDMARFRAQVEDRMRGWGLEDDMPLTEDDKNDIRQIVKEECSLIFAALSRGEHNNQIVVGSQHFKDSHRGLYQQMSDVYAALARGNQAGDLPPDDQHFKDSHRGLHLLLEQILEAVTAPPPPPA